MFTKVLQYLVAAVLVGIAAFASFHYSGGRHSPTLVPITTSSEAVRDLYLQGRGLAERHRRDEALAKFERAIELDSSFAMAYLQISRLLTNSADRTDAIAHALALTNTVSEGERLEIAATDALQSRHVAPAGWLLRELVEKYPNDPRTHNDLGNYFYLQKDWAAAIEQYLIANQLDSTFSEPYNGLGYSYRYQGNIPSAERYFLKYLGLNPDDPNPYDSYADLLTEMNRHAEAISFYRRALDINPGFPASHLGIATNYNMLGEFAKARDQLNYLLDSATVPDDRHRALVGLAISYVFEGNLKEAARQFNNAAKLAREDGDPVSFAADLDCLGKIRLEVGQPDEAAQAFIQSLQVIQSNAASLPEGAAQTAELEHQQRMVLVWLVRGNIESASACADRFVELAAQSDDPALMQLAHETSGLVELAAGRPQEAIRQLSQTDFTRTCSEYYMARAYEMSGNYTQALKYYGQALDYDQYDPLFHALVQRRTRDKVSAMLVLLREPGRGQSARKPLAGDL